MALKQVTARKDYPNFGIKKGQIHWVWEMGWGEVHRSLEKPLISETKSLPLESRIWQLYERLQSLTELADFERVRDELLSILVSTESTYNDLSPGFQKGRAGIGYQKRIEGLRKWITVFDSEIEKQLPSFEVIRDEFPFPE